MVFHRVRMGFNGLELFFFCFCDVVWDLAMVSLS